MDFLRKRWVDIGLALVVPVGIFVWLTWRQNTLLQNILWINAMMLLIHHFEEYRFPGQLYLKITHMLFHKNIIDDDVTETNDPLVINILIIWLTYFLAAVFAGPAVWLGIAAVLVSVGNFLVHAIFINWKDKRKYNPGMISAIGLFLPVSIIFFTVLIQTDAAAKGDWIAGLVSGALLNMVGIIKVFEWFKAKIQSFLVSKIVA